MLLYWHPNQVSYNFQTLFWTALPVNLMLPIVPTAAFFLAIDRCLILLLSTNYDKKKMINFARIAFFTIFFVMMAMFVIQILPTFFNHENFLSCQAIECFFVGSGWIPNFYNHFQWGICVLNIFLGIQFLLILKYRQRKNHVITGRKMVRFLKLGKFNSGGEGGGRGLLRIWNCCSLSWVQIARK